MKNSSAINVFNKWLDQYLNFERLPQKNIFWLDTMQFLCKRFGNPENFCPSIHVAGSKGKGSISIMIASILKEAGYKTGIYSSPHILEFTERISTPDGKYPEEIYERSVVELMKKVESIIPEQLPAERPLTWFELVTLFAMLCFRNAANEWSVFEVGLGGRLDATNVISPKICCISTIELEHTEFLGDTIEKIAFEKAGIIKENTPVIVSRQKPEAKKVFERVAAEKNAPLIFIEDAFSKINCTYKDKKMLVNLESELFARPIDCVLQMPGEFQARNAAVACAAIKTILPEISEDIIKKGLSKTKLPGRFEIVENVQGYRNIPELILDGAHTVNSIKFTLETFNAIYENSDALENAHLLFACAADKDVEDISLLFKEKFRHIMLTKPGEVKASDTQRMEAAFNKSGIPYEYCGDYLKAIEYSLKLADENKAPLLVTGSFYLIAEVKKFLLGKKCIIE